MQIQSLLSVALSQQLDLSQNISLRNICLDDIIEFRLDSLVLPPGRPPSCDWIISIISRIAHHSLESVTLNIFPSYKEELNILGLSTLDTLFLRKPLSENLTKLCFCIYGAEDRNTIRAMLKDQLPGLDGQGRLEFDVKKFNTKRMTTLFFS